MTRVRNSVPETISEARTQFDVQPTNWRVHNTGAGSLVSAIAHSLWSGFINAHFRPEVIATGAGGKLENMQEAEKTD